LHVPFHQIALKSPVISQIAPISLRILLALFTLAAGLVSPAAAAEIRLLVRADDMGVAQSIDQACIQSYRDGIARSVEVIVPGPWFLHTVKLLKQNPDLDVGVHLCLTSEWENCKWGPLTHAPSLVDENGYFFPMTRQRQDFPPNTGFLEAKPNPAEVERELRAQIELAKKHIPRISHLSAHMGTATSSGVFRDITSRLAREYGLRFENTGLKYAHGFTGKTAEEREKSLLTLLEKLESGTWLLVEHPGLDTPELRNFGHIGYENVADDRAGVTHAFTSPAVKALIAKRNIELISYSQLPLAASTPSSAASP
jgi:predicted glycoside hydrolase/deacetylase ChbG (UPF0249 family)